MKKKKKLNWRKKKMEETELNYRKKKRKEFKLNCVRNFTGKKIQIISIQNKFISFSTHYILQ